MEAIRELKAETLQDRIEVNKLDIIRPHSAENKQEKDWKARRAKLTAGSGHKQGRSRGYRHGRDDQ